MPNRRLLCLLAFAVLGAGCGNAARQTDQILADRIAQIERSLTAQQAEFERSKREAITQDVPAATLNILDAIAERLGFMRVTVPTPSGPRVSWALADDGLARAAARWFADLPDASSSFLVRGAREKEAATMRVVEAAAERMAEMVERSLPRAVDAAAGSLVERLFWPMVAFAAIGLITTIVGLGIMLRVVVRRIRAGG